MRKPATMAALILAALIGPAVYTASAEARLDRIGPTFQQRESVYTFPSVPTDGAQDKEREQEKIVRQVLLNKFGGGGSRTVTKSGRKPNARCYVAEEMLVLIVFNNAFECFGGMPTRQTFVFIDPRLKPKGPGTPPKYSASGGGADDLKGDPRAIRKAIARLAAFEGKRRQPYATKASLVLSTSVELLANPLAHRSTRKTIVRQLLARGGYSEPVEATDPRGRDALLITLADTSRAHEVLIGGAPYDLTGSAELTRELYVDPDTSDVLAFRTVLESTTRPEFDDWLAEQGGSAVVGQRVYDEPREVRDDAFRQRRLPCKKVGVQSDGYCIDYGKRGGAVIVRAEAGSA